MKMKNETIYRVHLDGGDLMYTSKAEANRQAQNIASASGQPVQVTDKDSINRDQRLYVIGCGSGYSCLGFDVAQTRMEKLAAEMGVPVPVAEPGTAEHYAAYCNLYSQAAATGRRFTCELTPQLIGLEGHRVEVVTDYDETRRFIVGKSTGWIPIHLEIKTRRSYGGMGADSHYKSVRDLGRVRR